MKSIFLLVWEEKMEESLKKCAKCFDETLYGLHIFIRESAAYCQNFQVKGKKYKVMMIYIYATWK